MNATPLPKRVRVLILGGGIHGGGVFHDLTSRGWKDILLLEKNTFGSGTSSRSTKLIHGGLRYLKRVSQFKMVSESLKERSLLCELVPDLVHPLKFVYPILKKGGSNRGIIKAGLSLYDLLAYSYKFPRHRSAPIHSVKDDIPIINTDLMSYAFEFWDAQTDDKSLVQRVISSGQSLGGMALEGAQVDEIIPDGDGWVVHYSYQGKREVISCRYLVNALGPWANEFLKQSKIEPKHEAVNNKGIHLVFPDMGLKSGVFLESIDDDRIFFIVPWLGKTLIGTTEGLYKGSLEVVEATEMEIAYLIKKASFYLRRPLNISDIEYTYAGLRWLAVDGKQSISSTSREVTISTHTSGKGSLLTIYGGKLTSYRSLSEKIGSIIVQHYGEDTPSNTHQAKFWSK